MENGLALIHKSENETRSIYIDEEVVEFAKLNAETRKRREAAANDKRTVLKSMNRRKRKSRKTLIDSAVRFAVSAGCALASTAGLIAPIISIPVSLFLICTACLKLGATFGGNQK